MQLWLLSSHMILAPLVWTLFVRAPLRHPGETGRVPTEQVSPLSRAPNKSSGAGSYGDPIESSRRPRGGGGGRGGELRNSRRLRGLRKSPAERGHTRIQSKSRGALGRGLRTAFLSPLSRAPKRSSGAGSYADRIESSRRPGGGGELRNSRRFRGLLGSPAEVRPTQITTRPRRRLGGCDLRNCRQIRKLMARPAQWCLTRIR